MKLLIKSIYLSIHSLFTILKNGNFCPFSSIDIGNTGNRILKIIGNGKSINDLKYCSDNHCDYMVVNYCATDNLFYTLKPRYYVLADPDFYQDNNAMNLITLLNETVSWNMILFLVNCKNKHQISRLINNHFVKIVFCNGTPINGFKKFKYYLYNKHLAMPIVQNVLVACIMIGIYMEYKLIELYGVEHSWLKYTTVHDDNKVYMLDPHFYDKSECQETQFTSGYSYYEIIQMYSLMFKSYIEIADYIKVCKIQTKVINMTKGSFIDAFPRGYINNQLI